MRDRELFRLTVLLVAISLSACNPEKVDAPKTMASETSTLEAKIARFAPTEISVDTSRLSEGDRKAFDKIIEAAKLMDPLFRRQAWSGNDALLAKLEADTSEEGKTRLHYFKINVGPWSRLDKNEAFVDGVPREKPPNANFYPDDMTKEEFESWVKTLSEADQKRATGFFWLVRRDADRKLKLVPYSEEYREFLEPAAKLLREAADLTPNATLKNFLKKRADAFKTDDYYASDVAWMELDAPLEITFGPYETYEDELLGYKAAFEAYVTVRDEAESEKLKKFGGWLQELENNLPFDPKYRNPKIGAAAPIRVVEVAFNSGDANHGVQTAAFNLPNDERVVKEKGSKRVMLKNVQQAKFQKVLVPISKIVLDPSQQASVDFEAFFTHILAHELMHGIGPNAVRQKLKEVYSAIEEPKADITGLWALQYLIDKGRLDKKLESTMYTTFLAGIFRSVRFGLTESHAKGAALQFNYLLDEGAFKLNEANGTFSVDTGKIADAVRKLTGEILTIEAEGSYDKAKALLDKYAVIRPAMQKALDSMGKVPVDIEPAFPLVR